MKETFCLSLSVSFLSYTEGGTAEKKMPEIFSLLQTGASDISPLGGKFASFFMNKTISLLLAELPRVYALYICMCIPDFRRGGGGRRRATKGTEWKKGRASEEEYKGIYRGKGRRAC